MPVEFECKSSKFVDVLRNYGPIPRNDSMYDELVQNMHQKKGIASFVFPAFYLSELVENFQSSSPSSVILTGTAGDGKTYYCRQVWKQLGGSDAEWSSKEKITSLQLGDRTLVVVKDLSELLDEQKDSLSVRLHRAVYDGSSDEVFLIAGNDGQLIDTLSSSKIASTVRDLKKLVEDLLVDEVSHVTGKPFRLYNLSRLQTSEVFPSILEQVLSHPGWNDCSGCAFGADAPMGKVCPIFENRRRLLESNQQNITTERLIELLRLCDLDGLHLPIRQQLLLITNILLGHPDAKDHLLKCKEVPAIVAAGRSSFGSLYGNAFGENLTERRRELIDVFQTLGRFGIGNETSNKIDNMLIFGSDDTNLRTQFEELVQLDSVYGADSHYLAKQNAYLEASSPEERIEFLELLRRQRQRLFFVVPSERAAGLGLWELTLYHDAGIYLESVYRALKSGNTVNKTIVGKLVKGLNRIFTGLMASYQNELILASSGHYSQARVCRVFEERISTSPRRGEFVSVELTGQTKIPQLIVSVSSSKSILPAVFELSLTRFEYICRVADGALPTSFSQECYEDILSFKTRILRRLAERRLQEDAQPDEDINRMDLRLLEITEDGSITDKPLEVIFCD